METKRIELKDCGVVFNQESHTYYLPEEDKYLSGITGMLQRQLFPNEFENIPERVLNGAADYGISVHASCENFDTNWINDGTQEVADYIQICKDYNLVHERSEYIISDGKNWASMIDKVYRVSDDIFNIGDIKTYGVLTANKLEKARWQLSVYAMFFEFQNKKSKVDKLFIIHLRNKPKKDGSIDHISEIISVDRIPSEICKELLDADLAGEQFSNPYDIPEEYKEKENLIRFLIQQKTEAEEKLGELKAKILSDMEAKNIRSWATETMRITRKLPSIRSSFNLQLFKSEHPELDYDAYMRETQVAGSLMIAI